MSLSRFLARCGAAAFVLFVVACSSNDDGGSSAASADELSYEVFPSTVVLDTTALGALTKSDADGTLHFSTNTGAVGTLAEGSVIVGGVSPQSPKGLLRFVQSVTPEGAGVAAKTVDAPIQVAFKNLHVKAHRSLDSFVADGANGKVGPRTLRPQDHGTVGATLPIDFLVFDGDNDDSTVDDQLRITGSIGGNVDYDFGIDFNWDLADVVPDLVKNCLLKLAKALIGETPDCSLKALLPDVHAGLLANVSADASLTADGVAYLAYSRTYELANATFDPIVLGPLVFVPNVVIDAKVEGGASSRFTVNVTAHAGAGAGVTASSKSGITVDPPHAEASASTSKSDVVLGAKVKVSVGPELNLKLFDVIGPECGFSLYAELDADSQKTPCYATHIGVDGNIGVVASIDFGPLGSLSLADYHNDFNLIDEAGPTGSCGVPPAGQSKKTPGTGPDDATFASPMFPPSAVSYSGAFGQFPYSAYEGLGYMSTTLSIDGRTLITGSTLEALTKVDDSGAMIWSEKLRSDDSLIELSGRNSNYFQPQRTAIGADGTILVALDGFGYASLEQNGSLRWVKRIDGLNGTDYLKFTNVAADGSGGFWLVGTRGTDDDDTRASLIHIDADGNVLGSQVWGPAGQQTYGTTLLILPDGGPRVGSWTRSEHVGYVSVFDGSGVHKNTQQLTPSCGEDVSPTSVALRPDGGYVMVGGVNSEPAESFFMTFDVNGNIGSQSSFAKIDISDCSPDLDSVVPLNSTGFVVGGTCFNTGNAQNDALVLGLDAKGLPLWGATYGLLTTPPMGGSEGFASVRVTDDGGALFAAYADEGEPTGNARILLGKAFAKDGVLTPKAGSLLTAASRTFNGGSCTMSLAPSAVAPTDAPVTATDLSAKVHVEPVVFTKNVYLP